MSRKILNEDKLVLQAFLSCHIPAFVYGATIGDLDLMEHYEELFNYSNCLLDRGQVNLKYNSLGTGGSFVFSKELKKFLFELILESEDYELTIFASLSLCTMEIIKKYGISGA